MQEEEEEEGEAGCAARAAADSLCLQSRNGRNSMTSLPRIGVTFC